MNCKVCGEMMKQIPAGVSKKTGKPYESFMSCPNRCKSPVNNAKPQKESGELLILEEIGALNRRFDKLVKYLIEKLGQPTSTDLKNTPFDEDN